MIKRSLYPILHQRLFSGKVILILGPRQVGKTTLARQIMAEYPDQSLWLSGDDPETVQVLRQPSLTRLQSLVGTKTLLVVDEAQRIPGIGITLKLLHDNMPGLQILATGSSALDLAEQTAEPLTGRKWEYLMLPLSFEELRAHENLIAERGLLHQRLVFGAYPEIINAPGSAREPLNLLANSYLYKDLFRLEQLKKPQLLENIVRALAFQVGNELSYNEIGQLVSASPQTVEKYIDLLEKAYIVFRLPALSRNERNEIRKSRKIYFFDNGIRNAVIGNFTAVESRTDVGALWENYLVSERRKRIEYDRSFARAYFWRSTNQQEIDYVEEIDGQFLAAEFKWNPQAKVRFPAAFLENYAVRQTLVVTPENYDEFLMAHSGV
ncbi:MAG: ATP-binding protein [Bacteroidota bacterium]